MDPPWESRSADRRHRCVPGTATDLVGMSPADRGRSTLVGRGRASSYATLPNFALFQLPIGELLAPATSARASPALLALWVTNRPRFRAFAHEDLMRHWGTTVVATWYWLKVGDAWEDGHRA